MQPEPEEDTAEVRWHVVKKASLKAAFELDGEKTGTLKVGSIFTELERRGNRVRCERGWVSVMSEGGNVLLEELVSEGRLRGEARRRWEEAMARMHDGTSLLFSGRLEEAEAVFATGMEQALAADAVEGEHDLRGAFALNFALAAVIKGVASMENDQLDECRARLLEADRLAAAGDAWAGQDVVRGICTLQLGAVQVLQHAFAKGVWNVLRSW